MKKYFSKFKDPEKEKRRLKESLEKRARKRGEQIKKDVRRKEVKEFLKALKNGG